MTQSVSTWVEALKNADAFGLDLETTSTNPKAASIYNIGVSSFRGEGKHKNFFMPNIVDADNLEQSFLDAHKSVNSKLFAKGQVDRKILEDYSAAIQAKDLQSVDTAFSSFSRALEESKGSKFILGQNLGFENRIIKEIVSNPSNLEGQNMSQATLEGYNKATRRGGTHRTVGVELFSQYDIDDVKLGLGGDGSSLQQKSRDILKSFKNSGVNSSEAMSKMREYSSHYDKVMDKYKELITSSAKGPVPIVDLQDVSKALYARAALAGDLKPEYFNRAYSVDFLSNSLLSSAEKHLGAEDNITTKKIFDIFTTEYDKYSQDPNYKSEVMQGINSKIESTNETSKSFIKNLMSHINEDPSKASASISNSLDYYSHIEHQKGLRETIHAKTLSLLGEENGADKAVEYLGGVDLTSENKPLPKKAIIEKPKSNLKRNIIAGAAVFGAGMMLSSGQEEKKYNTYDELYNDQYYGSGFADWQNRDKSHTLNYKGVGW